MKPLTFYHCETLVCLKLFYVTLDDAHAHFVSFPCLKTMSLADVVYPNEATFEKLVSSCPVLEDLVVDILVWDANVFRVRSQSLKRFTLTRPYPGLLDPVIPGVVVDAPLLSCLSINNLAAESIIVNNMESEAKLDIAITFGPGDVDDIAKRSRIRSFLLGVSKVGDMTLCAHTFEVYNNESNAGVYWTLHIFLSKVSDIHIVVLDLIFSSSASTRNSNHCLDLVTCPGWMLILGYLILNGYQPFLRAAAT